MGIGCITGGFVIVGVTLYLLAQSIDANFIAALYFNMFTTTTKSLTTQHDRLISTHFLRFGNFLATKVDSVKYWEPTEAAEKGQSSAD